MAGSLLFQQHFLPLFFGNDSNLLQYTSYVDFKEEFSVVSSNRRKGKSNSTKKFFKEVKKLVKKKKHTTRTLFDEDFDEGHEGVRGAEDDNGAHASKGDVDDDLEYPYANDDEDIEEDDDSVNEDELENDNGSRGYLQTSSDEDEVDSDQNHKQIKGNATLKEVQNAIAASQIFTINYNSDKKLTLILLNGTIIHVWIKNLFAQEYVYVMNQLFNFDEPMQSVAYGERYILFLFPDNRLVIARKPSADGSDDEGSGAENSGSEYQKRRGGAQKELQVSTYKNFLPALSAKKPNKRVALSDALKLFMIWWPSSKDDVFPWTPQPEERANILIYSLEDEYEPELKFFARTENHLLETYFIDRKDTTIEILVLESCINPDTGQLYALETAYQVKGGTSKKFRNEIQFPLRGTVACHSYTRTYSNLALGCSDRTIAVHCREGQITHTVKCNFNPSALSWHPHSHLLTVVGEQGQFQIFDIGLTPLLLCPLNSTTPSMTQGLVPAAPVDKLIWAPIRKRQGNGYLMIKFRSGELGILRLALGSMKLLNLVKFHLKNGRTSEATHVLKNVQWNSEQCLQAVYAIFGDLIIKDYAADVEAELEQLLEIFFVPPHQPDDHYRKKHLNSVCLLAKKFFMWMLRAQRFERALEIALSLKDDKLLRHLKRVAESLNNHELLQRPELRNCPSVTTSDEDSSKNGDTNSEYSDSYSSCSFSDDSYASDSCSSCYSYTASSEPGSSKYSSETFAGSSNSGQLSLTNHLPMQRFSASSPSINSGRLQLVPTPRAGSSASINVVQPLPDHYRPPYKTPSPRLQHTTLVTTPQVHVMDVAQRPRPPVPRRRSGMEPAGGDSSANNASPGNSKIMIVHLGSV